MKIRLLTVAAAIAAASAWAGEAGEWVSLFDGSTLDGWKQLNGTAKYQAVDGAIVGETVPGSPNSFLCSEKEYGDFELELEVKCDDGLNSGVQIRSAQKGKPQDAEKPAKNNEEGRVYGPQVEIVKSPGWAGYIYGEATGLGWLSPEPGGKDKEASQHSLFKSGEWNHFRIVAQGPRIQTFINGEPVADLTNEDVYKQFPKGFIGLQVHGIGQKTETFQVAWRNIRIRELQ
ncbi:MAG: hypothetical protein BWZ10_01904 [candidate division BRC1 bacterium ADurb.BinA364]|nr:MAG: hypothetical protein BWZ10_01904 [candidate division BRC1 bacterium ADurb.BinA364]